MKKSKFVTLGISLLGVSTLLTSCFGQSITRGQAIQILDDIATYQTTDKYTLGTDISLSLSTEKMDGSNVIQNYVSIDVTFSGTAGTMYVHYENRSYISSKIQTYLDYWAYVKNGYYYEKTSIGSYVEIQNEEEEETESKFIIDTVCTPPKSNDVLALFYAKYVYYFDLAVSIINEYNRPKDFVESLTQIDSVIENNYIFKENYYTKGNRCVELIGEQSRPVNNGKRLLYQYNVEFYDARLTSYFTNDILNNSLVNLEITYAATLQLPKLCETGSDSSDVPEFDNGNHK